MTAANFAASLAFALTEEGGWSDDPSDKGGPTNQGITLATFRAFTSTTATIDDLRAMDATTRDTIYRNLYWIACECDDLPGGPDLLAFNFAVTSGPGRSARLLQVALGVAADGVIGPVTLEAAADAAAGKLIEEMREQQESYYRRALGFPTFGAGWLARLDRCADRALELVGVAG